jgi:hypothetical protein
MVMAAAWCWASADALTSNSYPALCLTLCHSLLSIYTLCVRMCMLFLFIDVIYLLVDLCLYL